MRILEWETFIKEGLPVNNGFAAVTVGVFDGVHRGHRAIIERVTRCGRQALPVIVTFRKTQKNSKPLYHGNITGFKQKTAIFQNMGLAVTVAADLSDTFRRISGEQFFNLLREHGKMGFLAVGSNFRCGHNLDTDAAAIEKMGAMKNIPVDIAEILTEEGSPISSSRIRKAINNGKLKEAALMLGRNYVLDISGANTPQLKSSNGDIIYDTSANECVIPPAGKYTVLLHEENCGSKQINIEIKENLIQISACLHPAASSNLQLEFIC